MQSMDFGKPVFPADMSRKVSPFLAGPWFLLALAMMILVTYNFDLITPLGVPVWLLYFVPLILSYWSTTHYTVPMVCIATLVFLGTGYFLSPPGIPASTALFMRTLFSVVFISTAITLWMMRRLQDQAEIIRRSRNEW